MTWHPLRLRRIRSNGLIRAAANAHFPHDSLSRRSCFSADSVMSRQSSGSSRQSVTCVMCKLIGWQADKSQKCVIAALNNRAWTTASLAPESNTVRSTRKASESRRSRDFSAVRSAFIPIAPANVPSGRRNGAASDRHDEPRPPCVTCTLPDHESACLLASFKRQNRRPVCSMSTAEARQPTCRSVHVFHNRRFHASRGD